MSLPILTWVYDRKHIATPKREGTIELRITVYKTVKYLSTGIRVLPKEWNGYTVVKRPDCLEIQESMSKFIKKVRTILNGMDEINLGEIKELMKEKEKITFIEYVGQRMVIKKFGKSKDTQERYERFYKFLKDYGKITYFNDLTDVKILALDKYLTNKKMKPYSKWNNYHRFLNSYILDAISDGYVKTNPYRWLHIDKDKISGIRKFLTPEEFEKIKKVKLSTDCLRNVRDVFVFQTYTCLSYVDLADFDLSKAEEVNGSLIYSGKRGKTGQEYTFLLLGPARSILDKYDGKLPIISNVNYNSYLKLVAQAAGIDKPITSHWARHTGATLLLNSGIDMEVVAKVLGHSSTRQTRETYAALLKGTIIKEMKKVKV